MFESDKTGVKKYFYSLLCRYLEVFIRPGNSVFEIESQSKLDSLPPDKPEYFLLNGNVHYQRDLLSFFRRLRGACGGSTRVVILYYSALWKPLARLASFLKIRNKTPEQNWIDHGDIVNILALADFEPVFMDRKVLVPLYIPVLSNLINRYLAPLPFLRAFCLVNILVARPLAKNSQRDLSVSVVVPARNEAGNIENIIRRMPKMGPDDEVIFVEGHSKDNTWQEILRVCEKYGRDFDIKCVKQDGAGKADAMRKGFSLASKDIFMILDADLSVSPESLPDFYQAIRDDRAEFLNGSRLVYPHDGAAMRFLNMAGNKFFAAVFSFLVGQRFKDTLCGTKVISRKNYEKIAASRSFFGDFDPFGDFDLILGASRLCLKIREVPVRYYERVYGSTNIRRWKHGLILLRMAALAARKLKFR